MIPYAWRQDELVLQVRVQPRATQEKVTGVAQGRLRISLTAPPVDGAANEALCRFLASQFRIAKGHVRLLRGETGREKSVSLTGVDPVQGQKLLDYWCGPPNQNAPPA